MLKTNEKSVVEFYLQCQPGMPRTRGGWRVDRHGKPFILPSIGAITSISRSATRLLAGLATMLNPA